MAGIGFELKRIYGRKTLSSKIFGTLYATMSTVGPILIMVLTLLLLQLFMSQTKVSELELRFFISSTTYAFTCALLVSSILTATISRYIADCIFLLEENKICSAMYGSMTLATLMSGTIMLLLCRGAQLSVPDIPSGYLLCYYFLGVLAANTYVLMAFASALNEYKQITWGFLSGLIITAAVYSLFKNVFLQNAALSACVAVTACFLTIALILVYQCTKKFFVKEAISFKFLTYFKKYPMLLFGSLFYTFGIYNPMLTYWFFSAPREHVGIFYTMPNFDMAFFLAFLVNLPSMVIFVVKVETSFYDVYQNYVSALNTGSYALIERERGKMARVLRHQLFFVYEIQFVLTIISICLFSVYLPYMNISAATINMFVLESLGVYAIYSMYYTIIVLYYFTDLKNAMLACAIFFAVTAVFTVVALYNGLYALPALAGGVVGWISAFLFLRNRLENLTAYLMC